MRHIENALAAKLAFIEFAIPRKLKVEDLPLEGYIALFIDEMADEQLELLVPHLAELARGHGLPFEIPMLSDEGKTLITNSPTEFLKHYELRLRRLDIDPHGILYI